MLLMQSSCLVARPYFVFRDDIGRRLAACLFFALIVSGSLSGLIFMRSRMSVYILVRSLGRLVFLCLVLCAYSCVLIPACLFFVLILLCLFLCAFSACLFCVLMLVCLSRAFPW